MSIVPRCARDARGLRETTIRAWADEGVLVVAKRAPRLLLDAISVREVSDLMRQLRAAGKQRDLLDEIGRRLRDQALIERHDFQEILAEMRCGERTVRRPLPDIDAGEQ